MKYLRWLSLGAASLLAAGCASSGGTAQHAPSARPSAKATADALPPSIQPLCGASVRVDDATWTVRLSRLVPVNTSAQAKSVPSGWRTAKADLTFTNTTDQIQDLPTVSVEARYGSYGRPATQFTDTGINGLPSITDDGPPRTAPGGSFTTGIGVAIPADTPAKDATVTFTVESTLSGEASSLPPDFFEGTFPGGTATVPPAIQAQPARSKTLGFGDWQDDRATRLRLSPITVDQASVDGQRSCSLDLTVINDATDTSLTQSLDTILHVYYGSALTEGPTIDNAYQGYHDAPIAPQRAATETVHFSLPANAVPGPITIEADYPGGDHRITYQGNLT